MKYYVPTKEQMSDLMNKAAVVAEIQCAIGIKAMWNSDILKYLSSHKLSISLLENEEAAIAYILTEQKIDIIPKMLSYINMSYIISFIADICFHSDQKISTTNILLQQLMDISSEDNITDALLILIDANGPDILESSFWGHHTKKIEKIKHNIYFF